jgi:hypothetical protein
MARVDGTYWMEFNLLPQKQPGRKRTYVLLLIKGGNPGSVRLRLWGGLSNAHVVGSIEPESATDITQRLQGVPYVENITPGTLEAWILDDTGMLNHFNYLWAEFVLSGGFNDNDFDLEARKEWY